MAKEKLFSLTDGIKFLKEGKKIRRKSWRKTFSWIQYSGDCLLEYHAHGLSLTIYADVDLDNPGNKNNMNEKVWEVYNTDF